MPYRTLDTFGLADKFRRKRRVLGLSQEAMAARYGLTRSKYTWWEQGASPNTDDIPIACRILGLTPNELFRWDE